MPTEVGAAGGARTQQPETETKPVDTAAIQKQTAENLDKDFANQMAMLKLQQKANAQNTLMTALTTIEKGKDDVLRSIANNLK